MNWLWAYFRRKTMESILAGVHDSLAAGGSTSALTDEQAAAAARALVGLQNTDVSVAPALPKPLPQLGGPGSNNASVGQPSKRGPGRPPRKFQEPPAAEGPEAGG